MPQEKIFMDNSTDLIEEEPSIIEDIFKAVSPKRRYERSEVFSSDDI